MQNKNLKRILSLLLSIMLIAAMAVVTTACNDNKQNEQETVQTTKTPEQGVKELGSGATQFSFTVIDKDGNETNFLINTDKKTVGEALLDVDLIAGEESEYGLYVKTVNGTTLDYEKDKMYWSFYVNGKYATSGVDTTEIEKDAKYEFRAEKA